MYTLEFWQQRASDLYLPSQALISGKAVNAQDGATFAAINPATNAVLAQVTACGQAEVDLAVASARRAFEQGPWPRMAPGERKKVLLRLAELIMAHREELALLDSLNMGKPVMDAYNIDVPGSAHVFVWYGEALDKLYDQVAPTAPNALATITREALGVVGAVVPWNFPLDMAAWKLAPALAAGNSVVLKPAEQSPFSALRLARLALEAGLPEGVLNVVPGLGEQAGQALGLHPDVDCLVFTGSTQVGKYFMQYSAQSNLKQVWLECGGKSPNLVFDNCQDLDLAAEKAADKGINILIEPINTRDIPGFYLNYVEDAAALIAGVGAPNLRLQFDIYHRQIMSGDVMMSMAAHMSLIEHVQIASVPDRHEPTTGELNDVHVLKYLDELGYTGWVGCEYRPKAGTVEGLGWVTQVG